MGCFCGTVSRAAVFVISLFSVACAQTGGGIESSYGQGVKSLRVDAAHTTGTIRSLLGTNRGPISYALRMGEGTVCHVDSFRTMGIDFIRNHDFYGPTDWYVIFPRWDADPEDSEGYDFTSSDERIRAIVENGFRCFFRLGTSWRGRNPRPIHDPPGTIRDEWGRVIHRADRDDFRRWGRICARIVQHYTQGWKDGYHYPIQYWEIWNEPDLAEQFWTGTPEQYYMLYEEAARAIREVDPTLKVGGPACTGRLSAEYVEGFLDYCQERNVPLDFFSWHSYGGRDEFNPYRFYQDAVRIRRALDDHGFEKAENCLTEWNAGIHHRLFNHTIQGAAFYASTLVYLLDGGVTYAFQYCGDQHPGLGLHERPNGKRKVCCHAFTAWKSLCETPIRLQVQGSDERGYVAIAGKDNPQRCVRIIISDFQSGHEAFELDVTNLPWGKEDVFEVKRWLLNTEHSMEQMETWRDRGRSLHLMCPFRAPALCLLELRVIKDGSWEQSPRGLGVGSPQTGGK